MNDPIPNYYVYNKYPTFSGGSPYGGVFPIKQFLKPSIVNGGGDPDAIVVNRILGGNYGIPAGLVLKQSFGGNTLFVNSAFNGGKNDEKEPDVLSETMNKNLFKKLEKPEKNNTRKNHINQLKRSYKEIAKHV